MNTRHTPPAPAARPDVCQPTGSAELAMLDVYMPMMKSAAILSAGKLGLFEALAYGPLAIASLADKLQSSLRGTADLADFLVTIGYLERQGEQFANTASTQRWFTSAGRVDYTPGLRWTLEAWPMMGDLSAAVRRGGPQTTLWQAMEDRPQLGATFSAYMDAFAGDLGPDLLAHVPVAPGHRRLLDLGGSHGMHSIRFCQRHPQLDALIVDLPSALSETATTIARHGLSERIHVSPGELLVHDWHGQHDVVLYLSVAHNHTADENALAIRQIHEALNPGGLLVIHEYLADTPGNAFMAAFRLTLLYETGTQTYRHEQYQTWLEDAGFSGIKRIDLDPLEKGSLILARKA